MPKSAISQKELLPSEAISAKGLKPGIKNLIQANLPEFDDSCFLSMDELNEYRRLYLANLAQKEKGELKAIDQDVLKAIKENSFFSENIEPDLDSDLTLGQKLADKIAEFGGSWTFIIIFFSFLVFWMLINVYLITQKPFDPYPFILLNLMLSCLASIQAPIIMMSQNRQGEKDRKRAEHDYKVNQKAELEINLLNEKMDHLLTHQNQKFLEIQEIQIDYLEQILQKIK